MRLLIISLYIILFTTSSYSLESDSTQPLFFSADTVDLNQTQYKGIFIGNVALDQGSMHIRAAKAEIIGDPQHQVKKAIIYGNNKVRAHCWGIMSKNEPVLHAYADKIAYHPTKQLIELTGNALIIQGDKTFRAPMIAYDIKQQHVLTTHDNTSRAIIVIHKNTANKLL